LIQPLLPHRSVGRSKQRYIRELLGIVSLPPREQYRSIFLGLMGAARWKTFYSKDFLQSLQDADDGTFLYGWDSTGATDDLARAMSSDTLSYIPEDLNVKVDICSMACGLEVRSPFLDHRLVEFCARIPSTLKIHGMKQKHILKEAFWDELPKEILTRSKAGFALPISEWFRSELREFARDILFSRESRLSQVFQMEKIETMLDEHASGKRNWHSQLWRILVLESWFQAQASRSLDNRSWVDTVASN
jgi:asparagine synthase (glutamine-hydrolysing)